MTARNAETLAQRAERLAVRKRAQGTGMGTRDPKNYIATLSVQECIDADQLICDALAANAQLERERDEARKLYYLAQGHADHWVAERDAAVAERDRLLLHIKNIYRHNDNPMRYSEAINQECEAALTPEAPRDDEIDDGSMYEIAREQRDE